jgi:hypothetical protein
MQKLVMFSRSVLEGGNGERRKFYISLALLIEKHTIEEMGMDLELGPIYSIQKSVIANSITYVICSICNNRIIV